MSPVDDSLILTTQELEMEIRYFTGRLDIYTRTERREILKALHWSRKLHEGQKRESGEPYIIHPIRTAEILIDMKLDPPAIQAALLHDVLEDTEITKDDLVQEFGEDVGAMVEGVTKIDDMNVGKSTRKAASLRKMVWAMVDDLRVIVIKLADKRHNMNTLQYIREDARRLRIARECLEIYAPMAGKLGMSSLKIELEDLSFKYLKPDIYTQIREHVDLKKEERSQYLDKIQSDLLRAASKSRLKIEVFTRAKHFYSIYRKMKDRGKDLDEIYDLLGVRIICSSTVACYTMLGVVHALWLPFEGRFKDYIARPKGNGYRSLHTSVLTDGGRPLEIQIRSRSMHETAEFGIAAHWAYKEGKGKDQLHPDQVALVQQLKVLRDEGRDDDARTFLDAIKRDVLRDSIIVYTPKGDPMELPEGSTAIDLAYHIHSEVGEHCMGAKADGSIIPLTRPLENTQTIQILTAPGAHPHVNWLKHVRSARARSKIRNWLNRHDADVVIEGESEIDQNVTLLKGAKIVESHIKSGSVIEESEIIRSSVGPISRVRPGSRLIDTHIGNFVEVKKSILRGVKAGHLSYLGDSEIGEGTNIGAGTITCNYDGKKKYKTKIGKNVFVGSDTQIVAPVVIEDEVLIAAGTTVNKDVKRGSLAISRTDMKTVDGFYHKFFKD